MHSSLLHLAFGCVCLCLMPRGPTHMVFFWMNAVSGSLEHQQLGTVAEHQCNCTHRDA